jgi:hypothetical protein
LRQVRIVVVCLLLAAAIAVPSALAQSPLGTVTGLALDPSGAAIPKASVKLMNVQTGVERRAQTNAAGAYSFPNLPPGSYKVSAQAAGLQPLEIKPFNVDAYRTARQDLKFALQAATAEVTVTDSVSEVIQLETPSISTRLGRRQLIELPSNVRGIDNRPNSSGDSGVIFTLLPMTVPGVVQVQGGAKWLTPGAGATAVKLKVDGIETGFGNFGSPDPVSQPSLEAIQEFTANVLTNRAEFGGLGTITTVTRSGANGYHADLFWYMRNSALDARNTYSPSKAFQNIHNYGVSGGGPIKKDKTFFFFTFDGTHGSRAFLFSASVPTLAQRAGDFTGAAPLRNPFASAQPFAGNVILPQYLSPQALKAQQLFYPLPNYGPPNLTVNNYRASFNGPEDYRIFEGRVDHNFSSRHSAFLRYQNKHAAWDIPGARSSLPPSSVGTSQNRRYVNFWTLGDVYSVKPNLFNELCAGVVILVSKSDADVKGQALLDQIGIHGLPGRTGIKGIPNISITGYTTVTQTLLQPVNDGHAQLADNLTWVSGKHSMKFGAEMVSWFVNRYLPVNNAIFGNFSFQSYFTGNAYADFLLGLPRQVTRIDPWGTQYNRFRDWALYGQDDFKLTRKLTLSYGLRYESNGPVTANNDNIYSFDFSSSSIVVPSQKSYALFTPVLPKNIAATVVTADKLGLGRSLRYPDSNNLAPRFGFSYQVGNNAKTVVRGGWGIYYSHFSGDIAAVLAGGPYALSSTLTNSSANGLGLDNPFAQPGTPASVNVTGVSRRLLNPYTMQYSLSIERELKRDLGLRISYIGSKSAQLVYVRNMDQPPASTVPFSASRLPYPLFASASLVDNGAGMLYSGLQTQAQKRFNKGLFFTSTWTWAKEISEVDDANAVDFELNTQIENTYDRRRDRGNVFSVPRHQWMSQALYELPLGQGKLRAGWQLNALLNLVTGNWLTPAYTGKDAPNVNISGGRPDVVKSSVAMPKTLGAWFDKTAFAIPGNGMWGNAGRGIIQGPGYAIFNLGLSKSVRLEKVGALQFTASFQNVLNHVNWGDPVMTITDSRAGLITSTATFPPAGSPRTGLLGLRLSF